MSKTDIAVEKFRGGYNCAQSVLFTYADKLNLDKNLALKIATGFDDGMGRKQEVCGAVTGGIMVLSLLYGRGENDDRSNAGLTYARVREFMDEFERRCSTVNCKKLLNGCDLLTDEGKAVYTAQNMLENCCGFVDQAVQILEEMIKRCE